MIENQSSTKEQRQAAGLLSIGTFLEYFDLMLYLHMAVLLNDLFFPDADPLTKQLYSALSFCTTYALRPLGGFIFGYIGDRFGRRFVVVLTSFLMGICCITMAILPTYNQIGITSSIILTICRMIQGMSASAEAKGSELYLTETSKPPIQYVLVALITLATSIGTTVALGIATISINYFNWRIAFAVGASVALIGAVARTRLKETAEFSNRKQKTNLEKTQQQTKNEDHDMAKQNVNKKVALAYFFINCARPLSLYFIYMYSGDVLKHEFGLTPSEVISNNFWVSMIELIGIVILVCLSYRIYPLKILKYKFIAFFALILIYPIALNYVNNPMTIFILQCLCALFVLDDAPAVPIFYKYFPIFKRFTYTSLLSALARLTTNLITSFGLVYTTKFLGYYGILLILLPIGLLYFLGFRYFSVLEGEEL